MMKLEFKHFVALNALDVLTTYIGLTFLHLREANTFASGLFQEYGLIFALVSMKLVGLMVIYIWVFIQPLNIKKISIYIICFMYMLVVLNNSYQMIRVMA